MKITLTITHPDMKALCHQLPDDCSQKLYGDREN